MLRDCAFHFFCSDEALTIGGFFWTGDLEALAFFENADEISGIEHAAGGASAEPGIATAHSFDMKFAALQIGPIDIGNLQLTDRVLTIYRIGDPTASIPSMTEKRQALSRASAMNCQSRLVARVALAEKF